MVSLVVRFFIISTCYIQGSADLTYSPISNFGSTPFRGRPLLVTAGRNLKLERFETDSRTRALTIVPENQIYIVRSDIQRRHLAFQILKNLSDFVSYLPHDTFAVSLGRFGIDKIAEMEEFRQLYVMPPIMRVSRELAHFVEANSNVRTAEKYELRGLTNLYVLIAGLKKQHEIQQLCGDEHVDDCRINVISEGKKLLIRTSERSISTVVRRLAQHPSVRWIEERRPISLRNKYASGTIQGTDSVDIGSRPLWGNGLFGDGEIIGKCSRIRI